MSHLASDLSANQAVCPLDRLFQTTSSLDGIRSSPITATFQPLSADKEDNIDSKQSTSEEQSVTPNLNSSQNTTNHKNKKREVYRYQADFLVSSTAWCSHNDKPFLLAVSSFIDEYTNFVELVSLKDDTHDQEIIRLASFEHPFPATKLLWIPKQPDSHVQLPKLLATSADYLRLWRVTDNDASYNNLNSVQCDVKLECLLNSDRHTEQFAPLTSFDWNDIDPTILLTSSVDTTCSIWDIEVCKSIQSFPADMINYNLRNRILAHNHEVYDVSFSRLGSGRDVFVSCGGDGSLKQFDLRGLSSSTKLFELNQTSPCDDKALVRVACNKKDSNLVGVFAINSTNLLLIDQRYPGRLMSNLKCHTSCLNSISWAPHSAHHICSAGDDNQALIWDLSRFPKPVDQPLLAYRAGGKINTASWSSSHPEWISIGYENNLELLRV